MNRNAVKKGVLFLLFSVLVLLVGLLNKQSLFNYNNPLFRLQPGIVIPFYLFFGYSWLIFGILLSWLDGFILGNTLPVLPSLIIISLAHSIFYGIAKYIRRAFLEVEEFEINIGFLLKLSGLLLLFSLHQFIGFTIVSFQLGNGIVDALFLTFISIFSGIGSIILISPLLIGFINRFTGAEVIKNPIFQKFYPTFGVRQYVVPIATMIFLTSTMVLLLPLSLSFLIIIFFPSMFIASSYGIRKVVIWNAVNAFVIILFSPFFLPSLNNLESTITFQLEIMIGGILVFFVGLNHSMSLYERRQKEELKEDLRFLQKTETIDNLAGGISHDMANFIQVLFGYFDLLEIKGKEIKDETILNAVREMRITSQRASSLSKQLLTISKRRIGEFEEINLNSFLIENKTIIEKMVDTSYSIEWELSSNPPLIRADTSQLQQVLFNLILNAKEAMEHSGKIKVVTREVSSEERHRLTFEDLPAGKYVVLSVIDQGPGIPEDEIEKVFEPFYTSKPIGRGNGLGLTMVQSIIKKHNGFIEVQTDSNGTNFSIYFDVNAKIKISEPNRNETDIDVLSEKINRILVIDDEIKIADSIKKMLVSYGIKVDILTMHPEVDETLDSYDLVISDVIIPNSSGIKFALELRHQFSNLPIVLISGYPDNYFKELDIETSSFCFLHKPFTKNKLIVKISEAMYIAQKTSRMRSP